MAQALQYISKRESDVYIPKKILLILIRSVSLFFVINFLLISISYSTPICERISSEVEKKNNFPEGILVSISLAETGRKNDDGSITSWPWSLNHAGKSLFFTNKKQALNYLNKNITEKFNNIDVGCMQISVKWHSKEFSSYEMMLDPHENINYAAKFLSFLKDKHGSWQKAIKHYHSSTPKLNKKYFSRVEKIWNNHMIVANLDKNKTKSLFLEKNVFYSEKLNNIDVKEKTIFENTPKKVAYSNIDNNKENLEERKSLEQLKVDIIVNNKNYFKYTNKEDLNNNYLRDHFEKILVFRKEFKKNN